MSYKTDRMKAQISVLREIMEEYPTRSIDNIIRQLESRVKYIEENEST